MADNDPRIKNPGDNYADGLFKREKQGYMNGQPITDDVSKINDAEEKGTIVDTEKPSYKNSVVGKPNTSSTSGGLKSWLWKNKRTKGPVLFIATALLGGGFVIGGLLSPSLLLIHMKESLVGWLDSSRPALSIRTNKMLYSKFKDSRNAFSESTNGKCNIRCQFGSMNKTMILNYEARGFKLDVTEGKGLFGTRYTINSMTFPGEDGITVKSGAEFTEALKNPAMAAHFKKVFNSTTAYYLNSKFGSILREKFGLNKLSKLSADIKEGVGDKVTTAKERVKESIRAALGLPATSSSVSGPKTNPAIKEATAKAKAIKTKLDGVDAKAVGPMSTICTAYNIGRGVTFATKMAKSAAYISFAMMFLNAADQIKAGDADPDVISTLGDQLTQLDEDGKSATDAVGYRMAAFGDNETITDKDQEYSTTLSGKSFGIVETLLASFAFTGMGSLKTLSSLCKYAGSTATDIALACSPAILGSLAGAIPSIGGSLVVGAVTCAVEIVAIQSIVGIALGKFINKITESIAKNDTPKLDENTTGTAVGNSIYTGTAQILGGAAATYGLKAGNNKEIEQYAIETASIRRQENVIASYEAKDTPFDIYNPNSFLGSIAQALNITALYNSSSLASSLNSVASIIPKSLAVISSSAWADANSKAELYNGQCEDPSLESIGVDADALCNPTYVMSSDELNADMYDTLDYMIGGGYINIDTGEPIVFTNKKVDVFNDSVITTEINPYQLYLYNCANRIEPLGETSAPIEDENYAWKIGIMCTGKDASKTEKKMLSNFRSYTMDKAIHETMEGPKSSFPVTTTEPAAYNLTESDIADIVNEITLELADQSQTEAILIKEVPKTQTLSVNVGCNNYTNCKISGDDTPLRNFETKKDIFSKLGYIYNKKPVYTS